MLFSNFMLENVPQFKFTIQCKITSNNIPVYQRWTVRKLQIHKFADNSPGRPSQFLQFVYLRFAEAITIKTSENPQKNNYFPTYIGLKRSRSIKKLSKQTCGRILGDIAMKGI